MIVMADRVYTGAGRYRGDGIEGECVWCGAPEWRPVCDDVCTAAQRITRSTCRHCGMSIGGNQGNLHYHEDGCEGSPTATPPPASHAPAVVADVGGGIGAGAVHGGPVVRGSSTLPPSSDVAHGAPSAPTTEGGHRAPCGALSDAVG